MPGTLLQPLGEKIWLAEGPIVDFHCFPYPTRCLIVRLEGGALWVWSPITLTPGLQAEVAALGEVRHIVSPNKIHYLSMGAWKEAWPNAELWGLPSLIEKRADLPFGPPLGDVPPDEWAGRIDQVIFHGSVAMDEIVFFHRQSRTAIFGDLIENVEDAWLDEHGHGWKARLAHVWGITEGHGHAPLEFRLSFVSRGPAREALQTVLRWDLHQVVMAHGRIAREEGRAFVEDCFGWPR